MWEDRIKTDVSDVKCAVMGLVSRRLVSIVRWKYLPKNSMSHGRRHVRLGSHFT